MKKLISLALTLMLALSLLTVSAMAESADSVLKAGVLTPLNKTEEDYTESGYTLWRIQLAQEAGGDADTFFLALKDKPEQEFRHVFYDSLDSMLMALRAGEIQVMVTYEHVADYLIAQSDDLALSSFFTFAESDDPVSVFVSVILSNSFSLLLREEDEALRDELNGAILDMQADGTLQRFIDEQITAVNQGLEISPAALPRIEGTPVLRVAVTGTLPPMDYVTPDGAPAGFNTAMLAEIGNRIGRNIELVQVDSVGRAAALSAGVVDAVFWARTGVTPDEDAQASKEALAAELERHREELPEEAFAILERFISFFDSCTDSRLDMPEGTIVTVPYYAAPNRAVEMKAAQ